MEQLKPVGRISTPRRLPLLLVTEGISDIEFLKRISRTLHASDDRLPDVGLLEQGGELIFPLAAGRSPPGAMTEWASSLGDCHAGALHDRASSWLPLVM